MRNSLKPEIAASPSAPRNDRLFWDRSFTRRTTFTRSLRATFHLVIASDFFYPRHCERPQGAWQSPDALPDLPGCRVAFGSSQWQPFFYRFKIGRVLHAKTRIAYHPLSAASRIIRAKKPAGEAHQGFQTAGGEPKRQMPFLVTIPVVFSINFIGLVPRKEVPFQKSCPAKRAMKATPIPRA